MSRGVDTALAILNGLVGDHLARTGNGLALSMELVHAGKPLPVTREALRAAHPSATDRVALLVHGAMGTEANWAFPDGSDYGSLLARDLGFTPLYLRYNTGRAIADSGAELDALLQELVGAYPATLRELVPVCFSMGGLVLRAASHQASLQGHGWLEEVRRAIYIGTPHRGSPVERAGRVVARTLRAIPDPYTQLLGQLGDLRSAGIRDLGDADLRHEDRVREAGLMLRDPAHPVPLLASVEHFLIAGSLSADPRLAMLFGDALVPVPSATGDGCFHANQPLPPSHVHLIRGVAHPRLAHHPEVYAQLRRWLEAP
ncbi:MAG: alpha/beta hydrolase [Deltaproteobacteria bacterium]|nr:alpha/beta hydrolase [Deltaproteobacteria bacterium]